MGDSVKRLHNCPRVPLNYDRFFDARGNLVNRILNTIVMMLEVIEMAACPTFVSHTPDWNSYRPIQLLSGSPLNSGHPCDSHVRYDLSHFTSPPSVVQAIKVVMTLKPLIFVHRNSHHCTDASTILPCTYGRS